jgi:ribonuclease HII
VCAALLPRDFSDPLITDSKALSPAKRQVVFNKYKDHRIPYTLIEYTSEEIDDIGVGHALILAHRRALQALLPQAYGCLIVVDGFPHGTEAIDVAGSIGLPKADTLVPSVSLASILAKVTRDTQMAEFAKKYPGYGFEKHCGYGTKAHTEALQKLGPCKIHRKSYQPIKDFLTEKEGSSLADEFYSV